MSCRTQLALQLPPAFTQLFRASSTSRSRKQGASCWSWGRARALDWEMPSENRREDRENIENVSKVIYNTTIQLFKKKNKARLPYKFSNISLHPGHVNTFGHLEPGSSHFRGHRSNGISIFLGISGHREGGTTYGHELLKPWLQLAPFDRNLK